MRPAICRAHVREQSDLPVVIRRDKDGARFDIARATKLQNDLATLELRRTSSLQGGRWQTTSAADASEVLTYAFG
jgi:hypothetical protein